MSNDDLFSGRGSPAFLSPKEPAIKLLKERYSESFALTNGKENQVHLFLIKVGLWSLVYTFTPRDVSSEKIDIPTVLLFLENSIVAGSSFVSKLDSAVSKACERIRQKIEMYNNATWKI